MNLKLSLVQWIQLAACVELVASAIGKSIAQMAHLTDGSSTASLCLGVGVYLAAPVLAVVLGKPAA